MTVSWIRWDAPGACGTAYSVGKAPDRAGQPSPATAVGGNGMSLPHRPYPCQHDRGATDAGPRGGLADGRLRWAPRCRRLRTATLVFVGTYVASGSPDDRTPGRAYCRRGRHRAPAGPPRHPAPCAGRLRRRGPGGVVASRTVDLGLLPPQPAEQCRGRTGLGGVDLRSTGHSSGFHVGARRRSSAWRTDPVMLEAVCRASWIWVVLVPGASGGDDAAVAVRDDRWRSACEVALGWPMVLVVIWLPGWCRRAGIALAATRSRRGGYRT